MSEVLAAVLTELGPIAVAVSGGVDSLTLATLAHRANPASTMLHATSPAVPPDATRRTRDLAAAQGWALTVFDAGEFADPSYRANPVNRCFFCKTNLYGAIRARTTLPIASGTNLDDLGEYRPGLDAARTHGVRHPFVEAGIDKAGVRRLAASLGLGDVATLPSAPCLASRVQTGIAIEAAQLAMIDEAERHLRATLAPNTVRLRLRPGRIVVELDAPTLAGLAPDRADRIRGEIAGLARHAGIGDPVSLAPYRTGSAFMHA